MFKKLTDFLSGSLGVASFLVAWTIRIFFTFLPLYVLDLNFFIQAPMEEVRRRCTALAELAVTKPGYALGSGNSLCYYIPQDKALAMLEIANNFKK